MDNYIKLDQFLKWKGIVQSGGEAKHVIQSGVVFVNGTVETRRGRKLRAGDTVRLDDIKLTVEALEQ